jgi:excinuclease ABC subunit C
MECFDISNISNNHIVASMVRFKDGVADTSNYRRYRIKTVKGQNDFASMAEVVRRRYSRILLESAAAAPDTFEGNQEDAPEALRRLATHLADHPEDNPSKKPYVRMPDLIIVDGGKGQLSSACEELQRLGLHSQPIIGLAKEREEVYVPDQQEPIVMPHSMGALKLLQRIRDEAHRWANGYHQILMKRRIGESILDDCPGVSPAKKKALLAEMGLDEEGRPKNASEPTEKLAGKLKTV